MCKSVILRLLVLAIALLTCILVGDLSYRCPVGVRLRSQQGAGAGTWHDGWCRHCCVRMHPPAEMSTYVHCPLTTDESRDINSPFAARRYMPPEVINEFEHGQSNAILDGPKCDVFSFAVLALYAVTGVSPHEGLKNNEIFVKVSMHARHSR